MSDASRKRYLDLMQGCLTRELFLDSEFWDVDLSLWPGGSKAVLETLREHQWRLVERRDHSGKRAVGDDWPPTAETMIGTARLDNVRRCVSDVIEQQVPGDFIETGVWRGGSTIMMRAVLAAYDVTDRKVWVADSFEGLPVPDTDTYPADAGTDLSGVGMLKVSQPEVAANFARYGLLDDQVEFLVGWFSETLPIAPIEQLAVLRLDGDLYQSTIDALDALYAKLSIGGYCIVDDYGGWAGCKSAVDDFRSAHDITDPIVEIDWTGVYWQRSA